MSRGSPERRTISIFCSACRSLLYRYRKGGTGSLIKCFEERIVEDRTAGDLCCPHCERVFARRGEIAGRPVHRLIGGRVFTRGMRKK